jgi:hypothetical protein
MSTTTRHPLHAAVIRQLGGGKDGFSAARDAARYGGDSGFPGFCYYSDTCAFFRRHRATILECLAEMAAEIGTDTAEMVAGFRCLKDVDRGAIYAVLSGGQHPEREHVENALAWFALEEVGHSLVG